MALYAFSLIDGEDMTVCLSLNPNVLLAFAVTLNISFNDGDLWRSLHDQAFYYPVSSICPITKIYVCI